MNWKAVALAGLLILLAACSGTPVAELPKIEDAYEQVTLTPFPTDTPTATATSIPDGAEGIGRNNFV